MMMDMPTGAGFLYQKSPSGGFRWSSMLKKTKFSYESIEWLSYIEENPKIIRALNYPDGVPGKGYYKLELLNGKKIIVVQVMLRLFMNLSLDDPFKIIIEFLQK